MTVVVVENNSTRRQQRTYVHNAAVERRKGRQEPISEENGCFGNHEEDASNALMAFTMACSKQCAKQLSGPSSFLEHCSALLVVNVSRPFSSNLSGLLAGKHNRRRGNQQRA